MQLLRQGAVAHGVAPPEVPDGAVVLGDDRDRIGVVRVLGLGNEEGGEGDVFAPPEGVARDPREDVLAVRCAGDGNIALPEKLDSRGDGVPYFRVVQFGIGGTEPSSVTQMRADERRMTARWWAWKDSNLRLAGYEPAVLTI